MSRSSERLISVSRYLGIAGAVVIAAAVAVVALTYTGTHGERYSLANHFISELGEQGVSRTAWLFNAALVVGGVLFIPCCVGLGLALRSLWAMLGMAAGICAGVFCAGVGFFPMNRLAPHVFVAMWFFRLGLATTLLFAVAVSAQPRGRERVARGAVAFSAIAFAAYAAFLVLASIPGVAGGNPLDPSSYAHRPRLWLLAVLEWGVFFATVLWFLGVSVLIVRDRGSATRAGTGRTPRSRLSAPRASPGTRSSSPTAP